MKKSKQLLVLVSAIALFSVSSVFAGDWVQDGNSWKYNDGGAFATSSWKLIQNGNDYFNYYFDELGHMVTGVWRIGDDYYSFKKDGSVNSKGKVTIDGEQFETVNKGLIEAYPPECAQADFKGTWQNDGGKYKYLVNGVPVVSNWRLINSTNGLCWYYFDENGHSVTNLTKLPDGNFYYFNSNGEAQGHKESITIYEYTGCETIAKGQVVSLPNGFSIEEYEKHKKEEEESKAVEASIEAANNAAFNAQFKKDSAAVEAANQANMKIKQEAEALGQTAAAADLAVSLASTRTETMNVEGEENGRVMVEFVIPILKGANSAALNAAIDSKLKDVVYVEFESRWGNTTKVVSKKLKSVSVTQDAANHLVIFHYSGDLNFTVYLDTNTLDIWVG